MAQHQACQNCRTVCDVTMFTPGQLLTCGGCGQPMTVDATAAPPPSAPPTPPAPPVQRPRVATPPPPPPGTSARSAPRRPRDRAAGWRSGEATGRRAATTACNVAVTFAVVGFLLVFLSSILGMLAAVVAVIMGAVGLTSLKKYKDDPGVGAEMSAIERRAVQSSEGAQGKGVAGLGIGAVTLIIGFFMFQSEVREELERERELQELLRDFQRDWEEYETETGDER